MPLVSEILRYVLISRGGGGMGAVAVKFYTFLAAYGVPSECNMEDEEVHVPNFREYTFIWFNATR